MGVRASVVNAVGVLVTAVTGLIHALRADAASGSVGRNPVMEELEGRMRQAQRRADEAERDRAAAEEERARAEENARRAEEARERAEEDARQAREQRQGAEEARRKAEDDAQRAYDDMRRAEEERRHAEEARRRADEATQVEDVERRKTEDEQTQVDGERRKSEEDAVEAKRVTQEAEQGILAADRRRAEAYAGLERAKKALKERINPVIMPTEVEYTATKERLQYTEGFFHFAVTGISGSGKSSLINALRGLQNSSRDPRVARTGIVETTSEIVRYTDTNTANPFLWYDVPGAGTLDVPDWNYFNTQGLYVFDCIIVLIDTRFTQTDEAILRNCARFQIPTYIVRSKSKQHIQNVLDDLPEDDGDDEDGEDDARMEKAMEKYIAETQDSVAKNLARAKLPQQKVYMVDKDFMVQVVKGKQPKDFLDEWELLKDLLAEARIRRVKPSGSTQD